MTGRDLITASLKLIGAAAPGESISAAEATDGLAVLNRMLGSWSNESLLIHAKVREEFTLTANDQSYTMGSGADFNTTRPIKIERATIEDQSVSPTAEYPLDILTQSQWAEISTKESTATNPTHIYAEGTYPNETINLYPKPTSANKLVLYSQKALTEIAALTTSVSLPPGYDRALIFNLAIDLSPEYGRPVTQEVAMIAMEAKAAIKRTNVKPSLLKVDAALRSSGGFNIFTGDA